MAALALAGRSDLRPYDKGQWVVKAGSFKAAIRQIPGYPAKMDLRQAEKQYRDCLRRGFGLVTLRDNDYPPLLKDISDPPLVLYVWGRLNSLARPSLAMVGSRRATPYGIEACRRLSAELAGRGTRISP